MYIVHYSVVQVCHAKLGHLHRISDCRKVSVMFLAKAMFKQQLNGFTSKFYTENHIYFDWKAFGCHGALTLCEPGKNVLG